MVPWKLFWVIVGSVATLAAGCLPVLLHLGMLIPIAATAPLTVIAMVVAHKGVKYAVMFDDLTDAEESRIAALIRLAILVHAAWIVTVQVKPDLMPLLVIALIVISSAEYGSCVAYEYRDAARKRKRGRLGGEHGDRKMDDVEKSFADALYRADLGTLTIVGWEELHDSDD